MRIVSLMGRRELTKSHGEERGMGGRGSIYRVGKFLARMREAGLAYRAGNKVYPEAWNVTRHEGSKLSVCTCLPQVLLVRIQS